MNSLASDNQGHGSQTEHGGLDMDESLVAALAELDVLRQLVNLQIRNVRRQELNDPSEQILLRLFYAPDRQLPQVSLADDLRMSVSQTQKLSEALQDGGFVARSGGAPRGGMLIRLSDSGVRRAEEITRHRATHEFALVAPCFET